jgi:glyoxylase-like metal-dependent hydrolase (beta-lactamase superfamily II)
MKTKTIGTLGALLIGLAAGGRAASAPPSVSESSYEEARKVLDAALQAAGGASALQSVKDVTRKGTGTIFAQGQSVKVDPPYDKRPLESRSVLDFARRRSATETDSVNQGVVPVKARVVLAGDSGFNLNRVTNVATPLTPGGLAAARAALRRDPSTLLLTASSRAETLRSLGEGAHEGRPHRVVTFADSDGTQIALYVDARTNLLSKYETLGDNPVLGDALTEVVFSDYRAVGAVKLPFRVVSRTAGEVTQDLQYSEVLANTDPDGSLFESPRDAVAGTPTGPPPSVSMKKLAENVYLVEGSSHHSLCVVFKDHVVLVEAPLGDERSQAVIAAIRETAPGKPIRYVVPTHFHYDHTPGLRAFMAAGATIVTTPGNKAFLERLATTPRTVRPDALARAPRPPVIETFSKRRVFTDGSMSLELHDIGPNPHVEEAVVAYVPGAKVAFQSDLVGLPVDGPLPPVSPAWADFVAKVKTLGLQVETVTGGHGRVGTMAEVAKAVAASR